MSFFKSPTLLRVSGSQAILNSSSFITRTQCSDAFQVEQSLPLAYSPITYVSPIVFPKVLVGLGLKGIDGLTPASVRYQPPAVLSPVLSPTTGLQTYSQLLARGHYLALIEESIADGQVALPPVSNSYAQVQKSLSLAHTSINHASPIVLPPILVGLGLQGVDFFRTEASLVEYQSPEPALPSPVLSPTTGLRLYSQFQARRHNLALINKKSIAEGEVALLPPVSDFYLQAQKSLNFKPLGVQKMVGLDASQLERQSALYNLEHSDLTLDRIFSHSPPIRLEKRNEMDSERQLLTNLFKKNSHHHSKSQQQTHIELSCSLEQWAVSGERSIFSRSYQDCSEKLTIFQPHSGRDDLDLTPPTVSSQDDPRSPNPSTLKRIFLSFTFFNPSSSPVKSQFSESVRGTHSKSEVPSNPNKNAQIGLGLPSHIAFRQNLPRREMSSQGRTDPRRSSQDCHNHLVAVTEPPFTTSPSSPQGVESFQFLKPSHFSPRSLYDIIEVPTPSSTSSPSRGTPFPRNQWSSTFNCINPPQKNKKISSQLSTPSVDSSVTIHSDIENEDSLSIVPVIPATPARPGLKRLFSKLTRGLFKRSRSSKASSSSPVLIEHVNALPGFLPSSISAKNLQLLF